MKKVLLVILLMLAVSITGCSSDKNVVVDSSSVHGVEEYSELNCAVLAVFALHDKVKDECGFGVDVRYDFPQVDMENAEYTYVEGNAIVYNIFGKPIEGYENVHYKAKITPDLTCTLEEFSK